MRRPWFPVLLTAILLGGCSGELQTPGEILRIFSSNLKPAFLGERYDETIRVVGGLRPFSFSVESGSLPPGISLEGSALRGIPSEIGQFEFSVGVSDANLSRTVQSFTLSVTKPPPAELTFNVPLTDIRGTVTLRAEVRNARNLLALRTRLQWDPELFELAPDSLEANSPNVVLFSQDKPGELQVDLAVLSGGVSGDIRMFRFKLRSLQNTTLELNSATEFLSREGKHGFSERREGVAPAPSEEPPPPTELPGDNPLGG